MTSADPVGPLGVAGACDTHLHFYDHRYPVAPAAVLHPPDATVDDYRAVQTALGLERLVVVQPTTYGLDNTCQLRAAQAFCDAARVVAVVDGSVSLDELRRLTGLGVRGARFHMLAGGSVGWDELESVAERIAPFGWHIQLQLDGRELAGRLDRLRRLPVEVVVDHIGLFMPPVDIDEPSFVALLELVETGRGWVKLSAPYLSSTTSPPDHRDLDPLVDTLVTRVPERLVWGSNWPHPGRVDPPDTTDIARFVERSVPDRATRHRILVDNPTRLYDF